MKTPVLLFALFIGSLICEKTFAQITVSVNIASQPIWGPVGYDYVDYYYLPDIDVYYYVPTQRYIYFYEGSWISRSYLPSPFRSFNMYTARKVVINKAKPYLHNQEYRERYASTNEYSNQQSIRDSHDSKYFASRNHPQHSQWKEGKKNVVYHQQQGQNHKQGHGKGHN